MTSPLFTSEWNGRTLPGDSQESFTTILGDWEAQRMISPEHQRDGAAWTDDKRRRYVDRLRLAEDGRHPPGAFVTYQIGCGPVFLNDGLQRLTTLLDLRSDPGKYDLDPASAERLLAVRISVQHRLYRTHEEAMRDFQLINNGTCLTPYELCAGILRYAPHYVAWKPLLEDAERSVRDSEARLLANPDQPGRKRAHQRNRDIWAICHRFLSGDRRLSDYPDLSASDPMRYVEKEQTVEHRLRDILESRGADQARTAMKPFRGFIAQETATLERCMAQVAPPGTPMAPSVHRWLIHVAIWRRHNELITRDAYEEFAVNLLKDARSGYLEKKHEDGSLFKSTMGSAKLSLLSSIAAELGMAGFASPEPRKRERGKTRPGYDSSHILPFAGNGNGPTFPEPAPRNRSRGAHPVNENPEMT